MTRANLALGLVLLVAGTPARGAVRFSAEHKTTIYSNRGASGAARVLSGHLQKRFGVDFPVEIVKDASGIDATRQAIWMGVLPKDLGGFDASRLGDQGFWLKSHPPNHLIIYANSGRAYTFAVTYFAEKYLGFGWFWSGELGTVIPKGGATDVENVDEQRVPAFEARRFSGIINWGQDKGPRLEERWLWHPADQFHHNMYRIFPPEKYGASHPEYYPLINGKRKIPAKGAVSSWQPCLSNPDVVRIAAEAAIEHFNRNSSAGSFSLGRNDGYGDCECERCRAWDGEPLPDAPFAGLADRGYRFMNEVIEQVHKVHPRKFVGYLVYSRMRHPPQRVKPNPYLMPYVTEPNETLEGPKLDEWLRLGFRNVGLYYYLYGQPTEIVPNMYTRRLQRDLQRFRRAVPGRMGIYSEMYPLWPLSGPKHWMISQLFWNPDEDLDALLDRFCEKFYGPAAKEMYAFWDLCARRCDERWEQAARKWKYDPRQFHLFDPLVQFELYDEADWEKMLAWLKTAEDKTQGSPPFSERVGLTGRALQYGHLCAREYMLGESLVDPDLLQKKRPEEIVDKAARFPQMLRERQAYFREHIRGNRYFVLNRGGRQYEIVRSSSPRQFAQRTYESFSLISKKLGKEGAEAFWTEVAVDARQPESVREQANVQLARIRQTEAPNRIADPGFEGKRHPQSTVPERTDFPQDPTVARNGKGCCRIREVGYMAFLNYGQAVKPGQRWRASVWAKTNAGRKHVARITIVLWSTNESGTHRGHMGVRDDNRTVVLYPVIATDLPRVSTDWQRISVEFSIPEGCTSISLRLKGRNMGPGEWVLFDDVELVPITKGKRR